MTNKPCGLVDFNVDEAENGFWIVSLTLHALPPPGDPSPEVGDSNEFSSRKKAVKWALGEARDMVSRGEAENTAVFEDGSQLAIFGKEDL